MKMVSNCQRDFVSPRSRLVVALAICLCAAGTVAADDAVVEFLEGEVRVITAEGSFVADFGMALSSGDVIETGADGSAVIRLNDRSQVKLRENSQVRVDSITENAAVTLNSGGLFARVTRSASGVASRLAGFEVRTSSTVAGVRGTEFFVAFGRTIEDEPDVWLCVNEGTVEVQVPSSGQTVLVEEGEGINILGSRRITDPRFYRWTRELNWNFDPEAGEIADDTDLDGAYADLLDQDYD